MVSDNDERSRETEIEDFEEDPRFAACNREAMLTTVIGTVTILLQVLVGQWLGRGDPETYSYVWGMPAWFFYSSILVPALGVLVMSIAVVRKFEEMPLDGDY